MSGQSGALAAALVKALSELTVVHTGRTVSTGSYSYDYADIGDVVKLTRPVLAANGIVALTPVHDHGTGLACTVTLLHESGDRLDFGPFPFPHGRDAQATGSAVTYHRRYALIAALGMAAGDDDDGAKAQPAPVWNAATVKQQLVELCGGDRAKAARVWNDTGGASSFGPGTAADLFDQWEHMPAEGEHQ